MKLVLTLVMALVCLPGKAQRTLSEKDFLNIVKKFHPIAKSAALNVQIAKADVLSNRGAFDPVARFGNGEKDFDQIQYYQYTTAELLIPTWYGIDVFAGTERIDGARVNSEKTIGSVSYIGFTVPLLQNLVIDKRRAVLQQSRLMVNASEAERKVAVNDLLHDAQHSYWNWWEHYNKLILIDSTFSNAQKRLQMVRTSVKIGERPAIDTIEASTQVQHFESEKISAFTKLQKSRMELSAFLWKENNEVFELAADVTPDKFNSIHISYDDMINKLPDHPEIIQYNFKLSALRIEKKLKFQSLLPDVDLKYNQLQKGSNIFSPAKGNWFQNNYTYGITASIPLRLSYGRGEYRKAKLKIEQTTLDQLNKQVLISAKLKQYYTEWQQTTNQISIQANLVNNYNALQRGEEIRFYNGESSLFLINNREQKTLEAKQKLIEIQAKNKKAFADLRWSAALNVDN